jgi:hypothetical protein
MHVVHLYYWELRMKQRSRRSSILNIISLFSMGGNSFVFCKTTQEKSLLVQSSGQQRVTGRQIQVLWWVGPSWDAPMADPIGPLQILSEDYSCNHLSSDCTCFYWPLAPGEHRRQGTSHVAWLLWWRRLVATVDCRGCGCSPGPCSAATHILSDFEDGEVWAEPHKALFTASTRSILNFLFISWLVKESIHANNRNIIY